MTRLLACFLILAIAGWVLGKWPARWGSAPSPPSSSSPVALAIPLYQARRQPPSPGQPYTPSRPSQPPAPPAIPSSSTSPPPGASAARSTSASSSAPPRSSTSSPTTTSPSSSADWTQYDPEITKQLAAVERSGVPTYVIYPAGENSNADVLPELLTKDIVLKALEKDAAKDAKS